MSLTIRPAVIFIPALMSGCMSLSGLDAKSDFTCKAPDGVSCMSISGVSANVDRNNLPSSIKQREKEELTRDISEKNSGKPAGDEKRSDAANSNTQPMPSYASSPSLSPANMLTLGSGTPVRVPPKELRIWIAPAEDSDGDLHEQRYVYVVVNDGRWMVDAVRLNTRNKYTRFQPLLNSANTSTETPPRAGKNAQPPVQTSPKPAAVQPEEQ